MACVAAFAVPHPPLIVPAVGGGQERGIQATIDAYEEVARRIRDLAPDTIVLSSPHAPLYRSGFFLSEAPLYRGDMRRFRAPHETLEVTGDVDLARAIAEVARRDYELPLAISREGIEELDHASFVPLYFLRDQLSDLKFVLVGLSGLSAEEHYEFGQAIACAINDLDRRVVYIASGDWSHKLKADGPYGFVPEGPLFDQEVADIFRGGVLSELYLLDEDMCEEAAECGLRSFWIMGGVLGAKDEVAFKSELLSYEGPFGVGYGVAAIEPGSVSPTQKGTDENRENDGAITTSAGTDATTRERESTCDNEEVDSYVRLARESVEHFVRTGKPLPRPENLPYALTGERAGVFVSLHEHGDLRGCIGTIAPTCSCVADEIIQNGISAASRDPRFPRVMPHELDDISYSVDVLQEPEPIASESELDPKRYGVIVTQGYRRGLLLPNLEGVDTVEEQVAIAKRKAGISPFADDVAIERFEVTRHDRGGEARNG